VKAYIDTSVLVKRYVSEAGSDALDSFLVTAQPELVVSELIRLELVSTFGRKCREGRVTSADLDKLQIQADADLLSGRIELVSLRGDLLQHALGLMRRLVQPLATLDAIHLASALSEHVDIFMTNDQQLSRAAAEAGLATWTA
jgi:uncharacterized protein